MTLQYQIDSLEGLDEAVAKLYIEKDGKHVLDVAGVESAESVAGLKTALQKERGNAAAWAKYGTPDEIEAKIADLTEKAKGSGKGAEDAQAKLDAMAADYDAKLSDRDTRITKMMQRNASAEMKAELAKAGFISEAIDDIAATAMARLEFNEDGTPKVLTSDGKPMIGNGADHGATLADLAKELAEAKPYAVRDAGKGGGGKPAGSQGGTPGNKSWSEMTSGEKVRLHHSDPKEYERLKAIS